MTVHLPAIVLAIALQVVAQQPPQPRERDRPTTGTGSVTGTVLVDETGGGPLARVLVSLWIATDPAARRETSTDEAGRFSFVDLPAGAYTLTGAKASYVTTYFGAKRPGSTVGIPIAIASSQRAAAVTLRLPRGAVITGTVTDENGQSMPGVVTRLHRVTSVAGTRTYAPYSPGLGNGGTTDDRGVYRLFGLPPGEYVASVLPPVVGNRPLAPGAGGNEIHQTSAAELQWAERLMAGTAAATGPQTAAPERGAAVTYTTVYHPNVVDPSAAASVVVAPGQERGGVDVRVRHVTTARIEGTVVDPMGQPNSNVFLMLIPKNDGPVAEVDIARAQTLINVGLMASAGSARPTADGTFSMQGVAPGSYWLTARTTSRPVPMPGSAAAPLLWGSVDIDVDGRDIRGVVVQLAPGVTIAGRVLFAGAPQPADARVLVRLIPAHAASLAVSTTIALGADGSFEVTGVVPGQYRLNAAAPSWSLKSAVLGGRDVTDVTLEIKPGADVADAIITLTNAPGSLSGTLLDAANRPSSDLSVMLFSTNRSSWFSGSRRVLAPVRPDSNGRFTFATLPAGEYFLAAITDYEPYDWMTPAFLDQLTPSAIRITVADGEKKTQDLRIALRMGSGLYF